MYKARADAADIAGALYNDARRGRGHLESFGRFVDYKEDAAPGRLAPARGAAQINGLAGNDGGHGMARVHGIGVHDPRHRLLVGIHVGRGHILFRPYEVEQFRGITARHAFKLARGHLRRVADDAALRAAERDIDDGAFPGHPGCERTHFVQSHIGRVAYAAFGGPAREVVLDAIAFKDFYAPGVHARRDVDLQLAIGHAHHGVEVRV